MSSSSFRNGTKNHGICLRTLTWRCVEVLVDKDQSLLPCRTWGAVPVLVPPRFVSYFLKCSLLVCYKFFGEVETTQPCFGFVCCNFTSRNSKAKCNLPSTGGKISEIRYCLRSLDAWASSVADTTWDATWDVTRRIWRWWRITKCWWSHDRALSKIGVGGGVWSWAGNWKLSMKSKFFEFWKSTHHHLLLVKNVDSFAYNTVVWNLILIKFSNLSCKIRPTCFFFSSNPSAYGRCSSWSLKQITTQMRSRNFRLGPKGTSDGCHLYMEIVFLFRCKSSPAESEFFPRLLRDVSKNWKLRTFQFLSSRSLFFLFFVRFWNFLRSIFECIFWGQVDTPWITLKFCEETQSKHDAALSSLREANMQLQAIWWFSMLWKITWIFQFLHHEETSADSLFFLLGGGCCKTDLPIFFLGKIKIMPGWTGPKEFGLSCCAATGTWGWPMLFGI